MKISRTIRNLWREVEDILTAATGPILIVASALAAADIFSNHVFSNQYTWIPAAWAVARALAVTIWLGIAWEFYLQARRREGGGGWWLLLALALFGVDLQTALLFAIEDEHIAAVGGIPLVTIPAMYWAFEQAVLGVVLIAVHRAVDHQTHGQGATLTLASVTQMPPTRHTTQPDDEAPAILRRPAPTARRAYYSGAVAPVVMDEEDDVGDDGEYGGILELVSEERPNGGMTSHHRQRGPDQKPRKQRSDAGKLSPTMEQRIERLIPELLRYQREGKKMTLDDVEIFLTCSRGTASQARQRAWERIRTENLT